MTARLRAVSFFSAILLMLASYQLPRAQSEKSDGPHETQEKTRPAHLIVACSPDKPIIYSGETIRLKAYATSRTGKPRQYEWSAATGRLDRQGSETRWDFTGVPVGVYEAKVVVKDDSGGFADCSIRVIVKAQSPPVRGSRETGRAFLSSDQVETSGYGLYSYLLLGSRPTAATRERYLKSIEEYLKFPDMTRLETFDLPRRTLNITYLPIRMFPDQAVLKRLGDEQYGEVAEWILKQYDYERARVLLKDLAGAHREGPYIVSVLKPPTWNSSLSRPYLFQDQSAVPPHLISAWTKEFLNQAAQEQFWQERTTVQLALKLRTTLGIIATGLPQLRGALTEWVAWVS